MAAIHLLKALPLPGTSSRAYFPSWLPSLVETNQASKGDMPNRFLEYKIHVDDQVCCLGRSIWSGCRMVAQGDHSLAFELLLLETHCPWKVAKISWIYMTYFSAACSRSVKRGPDNRMLGAREIKNGQVSTHWTLWNASTMYLLKCQKMFHESSYAEDWLEHWKPTSFLVQ